MRLGQTKEKNFFKLEQWGGPGGTYWDMERVDSTTRIKKIIIRHASAIDSIAFQYEQNGMATLFPSKGGNGGSPSEIILQPDEFLTSIQGVWSAFGGFARVIRSLMFTSNMRTYGPYGQATGTPFSLTTSNVEIVGFHGRSGQFLDAIGIYVLPVACLSSQDDIRKIGPRCGCSGNNWDMARVDVTTRINKIIIRHDAAIDSIAFQYEQNGGSPSKCQRRPEGSIPPQDELWITAHTRKATEPNSSEVILTVRQLSLQQPDQSDDVRGKGGLTTTPFIDAEVMRETRELKKMVTSLQTQLVDMQKVITQLLQSNIGSSGR